MSTNNTSFRRLLVLWLFVVLGGIALAKPVQATPINPSAAEAYKKNLKIPRQAELEMSPTLRPVFFMACFTNRIGSVVCERLAQWLWEHREQIHEGVCQLLTAFEDDVLHDKVLLTAARDRIVYNLKLVEQNCACDPSPPKVIPKPAEVGAEAGTSRTSR